MHVVQHHSMFIILEILSYVKEKKTINGVLKLLMVIAEMILTSWRAI